MTPGRRGRRRSPPLTPPSSTELDRGAEYTFSNLESTDDTVVWDAVWAGEEDGEDFQFCVEGHSATVEDGLIQTWKWPSTDFQCGE